MMNRADSILPDSVSIFPNIVAFDLAAMEKLGTIPYEKLLVYAIDAVPSAALPLLAAQFDVLGNKGWRLAHTDAERRQLIKRAIELHRFKGTPWAIKQALRSIGFGNVVITEGVSGHWAKFSVNLDNNLVTITSGVFADVIAMIKEYKPARSVLIGVFVTLATDDEFIVEDDAIVLEQIRADDVFVLNAQNIYDGENNYDGSTDHSTESDVATIT